MKPKKSLGQHFLLNQEIAQAIVLLVKPKSNSGCIVEIGPGNGILTQYLIKAFPQALFLIEKDNALAKKLKVQYPNIEHQIFQDDILDFDLQKLPPPIYLIGNLPYAIGIPILKKIAGIKAVSQAVFMLQKEVVDRCSAKVHDTPYGSLSVWLQLFFSTTKMHHIESHNFYPPPKVVSSILILNRKVNPVMPIDMNCFETLVKSLFKHRRKMIKNNFPPSFPIEKIPLRLLSLRAQNISLSEYIDMANLWHESTKSI